jgi:hypothetical protein
MLPVVARRIAITLYDHADGLLKQTVHQFPANVHVGLLQKETLKRRVSSLKAESHDLFKETKISESRTSHIYLITSLRLGTQVFTIFDVFPRKWLAPPVCIRSEQMKVIQKERDEMIRKMQQEQQMQQQQQQQQQSFGENSKIMINEPGKTPR